MYDTFFYILQPPAAKVSKRTQIVTGHVAMIPNIKIDPKNPQKILRLSQNNFFPHFLTIFQPPTVKSHQKITNCYWTCGKCPKDYFEPKNL